MLNKHMDALSKIDEELHSLLDMELGDLRDHMIEMFRGFSKEKAEARSQRIQITYLLERMQDLEKARNPQEPYGRQHYQKLLDEGLRAMDKALRKTDGDVQQIFTDSTQLESVTQPRMMLGAPLPQEDLQNKIVRAMGGDHGGIILPNNLRVIPGGE